LTGSGTAMKIWLPSLTSLSKHPPAANLRYLGDNNFAGDIMLFFDQAITVQI
jgi:hypothetical protein